jgi:ribonuclease T2
MTADGLKTNCPATGIHYIPKKHREPSRTTDTPSQPTTTGTPFKGRGNLIVSSMGGRRGCIISRGKWFASGTCATFKAKATGALLQKGRVENSITAIVLLSARTAC